jgi:heme oxygenase
MSARAALRAATRDEHDVVDGIFSRFDLSDPDQYRRFLRAQAAAHLPTERALEQAGIAVLVPNWPDRRRTSLIEADLAELGLGAIEEVSAPRFIGAAGALGGLYVLEGSRLGGAMLKRQLSADQPQRFLGAPGEAGAWRALLATLDESLAAEADLDAAIGAARSVFRSFALAGRNEWER